MFLEAAGGLQRSQKAGLFLSPQAGAPGLAGVEAGCVRIPSCLCAQVVRSEPPEDELTSPRSQSRKQQSHRWLMISAVGSPGTTERALERI